MQPQLLLSKDFTPMLRIDPAFAMRASLTTLSKHNVMPDHALPQDGVASELQKAERWLEIASNSSCRST